MIARNVVTSVLRIWRDEDSIDAGMPKMMKDNLLNSGGNLHAMAVGLRGPWTNFP
jgi:hypothetical protein